MSGNRYAKTAKLNKIAYIPHTPVCKIENVKLTCFAFKTKNCRYHRNSFVESVSNGNNIGEHKKAGKQQH